MENYDKMILVIHMKEIGIIFSVIFLIGSIFVIPQELEKSKAVESYSFRYITQKEIKKVDEKLKAENIPKEQNQVISFNMDLRNKSPYTASDYDKLLANTGLNGLGQDFKNCDEIGVNSLFMIALACHESNYGNSSLSKQKNNLFGFQAYDANPYYHAKSFRSKKECINYVCHFIKNQYLMKDGDFFHGYTISSINVKYASDKNWANKIYQIMKNLEKQIK